MMEKEMKPIKKTNRKGFIIGGIALAAVLCLVAGILLSTGKKVRPENKKKPSPPEQRIKDFAVKKRQQPQSTLADAETMMRMASVLIQDLKKTYADQVDPVMKRLDFNAVKKDPAASVQKKALEELRKIVAQNRNSNDAILTELITNLKQLKLSEDAIRFLNDKLIPGLEEIQEFYNRKWDSERQIVNLNESCLEQLIFKETDWFLNAQGQILFKYEEDLTEFNGLLKKIKDEYKNQAIISGKAEKNMTTLLQEIQKKINTDLTQTPKANKQ